MPSYPDLQSPYQEHNTLPGIESQRQAIGSAQILLERDKLPEQFPIALWEQQAVRYQEYWRWFTGLALEVELGKTEDGKMIEKFPLRINAVRNFSRKHAALLFGEIPDTPQPMVRTKIRPHRPLFEDDTEDTEEKAEGETAGASKKKSKDDKKKRLGEFYARVVDAVWEQSDGSALMYENGIMSQFLGGAVFQLKWTPWRKDWRIPIQVTKIVPDFVLPIWSKDDPYELSECWIVYRIAAATVLQEFNLTTSGPWATYVEHWSRKSYSITIDGKPLTASYFVAGQGEVKINFAEQANPFGFVPIVYIPRVREGDFYGSSFVPDIVGLLKEFNGRWADVGTIIQKTAHRKWIGRNIGNTIRNRQFDNGTYFADLGMQNPALNNPPELWPEDSPNYSQFFIENVENLFEQMLREGGLTKVAYGYVDGTQRSGETLKSLFWPSTAIARAQRVNWNAGLARIAKMMLNMLAIKNFQVDNQTIPLNITNEYEIRQDWLPILPKDREQVINEVAQLALPERPAMSLEHAIDVRGDVDDPDEELERIYANMERFQEIVTQSQLKLQEAQTDAQMKMVDKQQAHQSKMTDKTGQQQEKLADKTAENTIKVAKATEKPTGK
jgi:hypothetical protein